MTTTHRRLGVRRGERLNRIAFPMGGIGAGMLSLEGTGALSQVSLRHKPDVHHEPQVFAALHVKGAKTARVLEGPVPMWKVSGSATLGGLTEPGNGLTGRTYGLPRFAEASFAARFPFATVSLADPTMPVTVALTGWSPFTPGAADDSSLPVAAIEYRFTNRSARTMKAVFSFHAANFMKLGEGARVEAMERGFVLAQSALANYPEWEGAFAACTDDPATAVDAAWFRGGWVTYTNALKTSALGVPGALIAEHGAVSEPVALAMASGALERSGADCVLALTGIAGPDGGTPDKPAGTVWIAVGAPGRGLPRLTARRFLFPGDRAAVRDRAGKTALNLLRHALIDK